MPGGGKRRYGQCHREYTACVAQPGDSSEENLRDIFEWFAALVRVKRWGKSSPPRWQHRGHGKPREVQDQIGGESWPGSLSASCERSAPLSAAQAAYEDEPSGRSLDPGREAGTRGMIVARTAARLSATQNPAYRLIRRNVFERKAVKFSSPALVARLWQNFRLKSRHL